MSDIYLNIKNRLNNWLLDDANSDYIEDLAHDLINRAQRSLNKLRDWDDLVSRTTLTVSGTTADLPSDLLKVITVYEDSSATGKPDRLYYKDANHSNGYYLSTSFDKDVGKTQQITFFSAPGGTVYVKYLKALEDFADDDSNTQYSFFPEELMYVKAKLIHLEDAEVVDNSVTFIENTFRRELADFERTALHANQAMYNTWIDESGSEIHMDGLDMNGGTYTGGNADPFSNDYDRGRGSHRVV